MNKCKIIVKAKPIIYNLECRNVNERRRDI